MRKTSDTTTEQDQTTPYWQDVENKIPHPESIKGEFRDGELEQYFASNNTRRDFLKLMGFSFATMPLASSCLRIPVKKALPYLNKSNDTVPGVANWYATSMDPEEGSALLVKTREGRPVKIEGNPMSPAYKGATTAYCQGSILNLYDSNRYKGPMKDGSPIDWAQADKEVLNSLSNSKETILVTGPQHSPSTLRLIDELKAKYKNFNHVVFSPYSNSAQLEANQETFQSRNLNTYHLENVDLLVSFDADFLGAWANAGGMTKAYSARRDVTETSNILKHIQLETTMTLTGSNADLRFTIGAFDDKDILINILGALQRRASEFYLPQGERLPENGRELGDRLASDLWAARGKSLVLSDSQNTSVQVIVNAINHILGNYGKTLNVYKNKHYKGASDYDFEETVKKMNAGVVGTVIFWGVNPAHDYYNSASFKSGLSKVATRVSMAQAPDETSLLCNYVLPDFHYLEAVNDYFVAPSSVQYAQPVIKPLFDSRQAQETFLVWAGSSDYYKYVQSTQEKLFYSLQSKSVTASGLWDQTLHDGVLNVNLSLPGVSGFDKARSSQHYALLKKNQNQDGASLVCYQKVAIRNGRQINNPWLLELPDPITKATWENYLLINPAKARKLNIKTGTIVQVTSGSYSVELPALLQPGLHENTIAMAVGFGRVETGKAGKGRGVNAFPFMRFEKGTYQNVTAGVQIVRTAGHRELAQTQTHHSMEGRDIVREASLKDYLKNPKAGHKKLGVEMVSLWPKHDKTGEQWAMVIDLNKCTGCSGCIVSCNAENNVPVVGPDEVRNRREMHWLRIDRYYKGDENNPEVVHQPVMCQHCDNAPCETVCPVLATVQSSDGLNQQVYNRCVGTRYCANNCPYKVRRFNWFDYPHDDKYENLVLNPDVVVRSRGVMEKCSMCVHRLQEGKLQAKKDGRAVADSDIKTACQQSCPADAIVVGNLNDPNSRVAKLLKDARNYTLLEELNVQPRVSYLSKIRNKE